MRYVVIPEPVNITGKPYSIQSFLNEAIFSAPAWRVDASGWDALERCSKAFEDKSPGAVVELSDKDHERIWNLVQSVNLGGGFAALLVPYFRAIGSASSKDPNEKKEEAST